MQATSNARTNPVSPNQLRCDMKFEADNDDVCAIGITIVI
mgnify:CR=1 FL=1